MNLFSTSLSVRARVVTVIKDLAYVRHAIKSTILVWLYVGAYGLKIILKAYSEAHSTLW